MPRAPEPSELTENPKIELKSTQVFQAKKQKSIDRSKIPPSVVKSEEDRIIVLKRAELSYPFNKSIVSK